MVASLKGDKYRMAVGCAARGVGGGIAELVAESRLGMWCLIFFACFLVPVSAANPLCLTEPHGTSCHDITGLQHRVAVPMEWRSQSASAWPAGLLAVPHSGCTCDQHIHTKGMVVPPQKAAKVVWERYLALVAPHALLPGPTRGGGGGSEGWGRQNMATEAHTIGGQPPPPHRVSLNNSASPGGGGGGGPDPRPPPPPQTSPTPVRERDQISSAATAPIFSCAFFSPQVSSTTPKVSQKPSTPRGGRGVALTRQSGMSVLDTCL